MNKKERITFIIDELEKLYPKVPIPLEHKDPYTLLIAVLLSAQCTDVRVNKITPILFNKADNPFDMIKMSVEQIKEIIRPCGLSPMKSKGIHGLSQIIINKYDGEVPADFKLLEEFIIFNLFRRFSNWFSYVFLCCGVVVLASISSLYLATISSVSNAG